MSTTSNDIDDVRRQMAMIRHDLHQDVKGVVATANAVTDWRRYLTTYPLVSLGVATAIGYLIVPRKKPVVEVIPPSALERLQNAAHALTSRSKAVAKEVAAEPPPKSSLVKTIASGALAALTPMAIRAAQGYAIQYLEQWLLQQQEHALRVGPQSKNPTTAATKKR